MVSFDIEKIIGKFWRHREFWFLNFENKLKSLQIGYFASVGFDSNSNLNLR